MSVYRCYTQKKKGFDVHAQELFTLVRTQLGIEHLTHLSIFHRYDVDAITRETFERSKNLVFSEPPIDAVYDEELPLPAPPYTLIAVQALSGQFDQRADSCAQCIQLMAGVERPLVSYATVYVLEGELTPDEQARIKNHLINPVESCEASMDKPATLAQTIAPAPAVAHIDGFTAMEQGDLQQLIATLGLAMDLDDLICLQTYFKSQNRQPTITEVRVVDTYWSDHCRHTTFSTQLEEITVQDAQVQAAYAQYLAAREEVYGAQKAAARPKTLMDVATIGAKTLKKRGELPELDESEEINACSIRVQAEVDGEQQPWLLMFKNETHNHPTEIEPFGGAATCIGGCIRDPLSGRAFVHQAMRVTGGGDPRVPFEQTLSGKLPQGKLATTAAAGYSSYGNQIGLATGHVAEIYHQGYVAKRLECGAVVGAAPEKNVVRARPVCGDVVLLLGGRTGRDGIGGATGSSKTHTATSLNTMASEVQKGNAPEERKIQRLFRDAHVTQMIKRCNDFGAGGVSVAIGELAEGLEINLDAVRKKYDGLDGTELAISESQERMAVVVAAADADAFIAAAEKENLEAYQVAVVTAAPRMVMRWRGQVIADLSREFLDTNGAAKFAKVAVPTLPALEKTAAIQPLRNVAGDLRYASRRGLIERFDGSVGAGSVLMPFGGKYQRTPAQVMAALLPVLPEQSTAQASVMAWGFDPEQMEQNPFTGAQNAVITSIAKLVAAGADYKKVYLSLQEFFEKLQQDPARWGKPFSALLGALTAQLGLGAAAIGGKDSMSGSFLDLDVPPTLISFAIAPILANEVLSPEFKQPSHPVYLFTPTAGHTDRFAPCRDSWDEFHALCKAGKVSAAWAVQGGGITEAVMNMSFGNGIGFTLADGISLQTVDNGAIIAELNEEITAPHAIYLGTTTQKPEIGLGADRASIKDLLTINEAVLEPVYKTKAAVDAAVSPISFEGDCPTVCSHKVGQPKAIIPVFSGTNSEYDTAKACIRAGIAPEIVVVRNLTTQSLLDSAAYLAKAINGAQMVVIPGGFSGGDEPDGSGKFIASFLRNPALADAIMDLLKHRDGLMLGICNGFQALIKLGLLPQGEISPITAHSPTLTYNAICRHQSRYVTTRVCSVRSPWMLNMQVGDLHTLPISHGEGRFVAEDKVLHKLIANGQIATQYVEENGQPSMDIDHNPNGSLQAIEGIFSPDGRVFGKMAHTERRGEHVARNICGNKFQPLFESGALYFK